MTKHEAHEYNLDAAHQALEARAAQGEDMSSYYVDEDTYEIKRKPIQVFIEISGGMLSSVYTTKDNPLPESPDIRFVLRDLDNIKAGYPDTLPEGALYPDDLIFHW